MNRAKNFEMNEWLHYAERGKPKEFKSFLYDNTRLQWKNSSISYENQTHPVPSTHLSSVVLCVLLFVFLAITQKYFHGQCKINSARHFRLIILILMLGDHQSFNAIIFPFLLPWFFFKFFLLFFENQHFQNYLFL